MQYIIYIIFKKVTFPEPFRAAARQPFPKVFASKKR